jgi:predicted nucleic acid-binding protein
MIVVDASVLANAVADDESDGDVARRRLAQEDRVFAPDLVDVEVASVLRRRWLAGDLDEPRLMAAIDDLDELPVERLPVQPLIRRAIGLRANLTAYDGVYVALAEAIGCGLLTADRRLAAAPGIRCVVEIIQA